MYVSQAFIVNGSMLFTVVSVLNVPIASNYSWLMLLLCSKAQKKSTQHEHVVKTLHLMGKYVDQMLLCCVAFGVVLVLVSNTLTHKSFNILLLPEHH